MWTVKAGGATRVMAMVAVLPPPATTPLSSSSDYSSSVPFRKIISNNYASEAFGFVGLFFKRVGLSQAQEWACPKSGPVPRVGLSQEWACPKSGPVPRVGSSQWHVPRVGLPRVGLSQGHVHKPMMAMQRWKSHPTPLSCNCYGLVFWFCAGKKKGDTTQQNCQTK